MSNGRDTAHAKPAREKTSLFWKLVLVALPLTFITLTLMMTGRDSDPLLRGIFGVLGFGTLIAEMIVLYVHLLPKVERSTRREFRDDHEDDQPWHGLGRDFMNALNSLGALDPPPPPPVYFVRKDTPLELIVCSYCGGGYPRDEIQCPGCGARLGGQEKEVARGRS